MLTTTELKLKIADYVLGQHSNLTFEKFAEYINSQHPDIDEDTLSLYLEDLGIFSSCCCPAPQYLDNYYFLYMTSILFDADGKSDTTEELMVSPIGQAFIIDLIQNDLKSPFKYWVREEKKYEY